MNWALVRFGKLTNVMNKDRDEHDDVGDGAAGGSDQGRSDSNLGRCGDVCPPVSG